MLTCDTEFHKILQNYSKIFTFLMCIFFPFGERIHNFISTFNVLMYLSINNMSCRGLVAFSLGSLRNFGACEKLCELVFWMNNILLCTETTGICGSYFILMKHFCSVADLSCITMEKPHVTNSTVTWRTERLIRKKISK